ESGRAQTTECRLAFEAPGRPPRESSPGTPSEPPLLPFVDPAQSERRCVPNEGGRSVEGNLLEPPLLSRRLDPHERAVTRAEVQAGRDRKVRVRTFLKHLLRGERLVFRRRGFRYS